MPCALRAKGSRMIMKYFTAANCITGLRMAGTLGLLFVRPLSPAFFAVYTLTGLTDVMDGWVARKTGTSGDFGAKLDSCADLLFYGVMLVRLLPLLFRTLPAPIWWVVLGIACLRLTAYLVAAIKYRTFASLHTYFNKLTGAAVFLVPYFLLTGFAPGYCWGVCAVAGVASLEELLIHLLRPAHQSDTKSLLHDARQDKTA